MITGIIQSQWNFNTISFFDFYDKYLTPIVLAYIYHTFDIY